MYHKKALWLEDHIDIPSRWGAGTTGLELDRPGHPDADPPQLPGRSPGARSQALEQLLDPLQQGVRAIRDVGHCSFTPNEFISAYRDLFAWVDSGVKPAGEDLVANISSPSLGCAFTIGGGSTGSGLRFALEACPTP